MNARLDGAFMRAATWLLIAVACAPPLYLRFLPMTDLPQYLALSRMLTHLNDPSYGFAPFYERALALGPACLPIYAWGALSDLFSLDAATRIVASVSVLSYPLALCALLRALGKPLSLALLGFPLIYASPFFSGLVPSSISAGLALLAIALYSQRDRKQRWSLLAIAVALPFTHPFGIVMVVGFVACTMLTSRRSERPWQGQWQGQWQGLWLTPVFIGAVYWGMRALHADGVAAYAYPGLAFRLLRLPQQILGGYVGRGEALLLLAQLVLWIWCCRGSWTIQYFRQLPAAERALWLFTASCALGYLLLPSSTWTTTAIHTRCGALACALLPALLPVANLTALRERAPVLLLALAVASASYANVQLTRFDAEAEPFARVLARVPARAKLVSLIYDNQGHVCRSSPYLHFGAYAQAAKGGFLALSLADFAWTVPLRRNRQTPAPRPTYGAEWEPALLQVRPSEFHFYDAVLVNGKEPHEMTILMQPDMPYRLLARSGAWLLYARQ